MRLYVGQDLHANNNFLALVDQKGKRVEQKKLANDLSVILEFLKPYQKEIVGIVVESTFNWYWLVDGLMDSGYKVHLANPSAIQQYSGLKHADDKHDAFWLAQMLRLKILPEGRSAGPGSFAQAAASGEIENLPDSQPAKYHQPKLWSWVSGQ